MLPIPGQGRWKISAGILSAASILHILIRLTVACLESVSNAISSLAQTLVVDENREQALFAPAFLLDLLGRTPSRKAPLYAVLLCFISD